jgi:hypothetical protein
MCSALSQTGEVERQWRPMRERVVRRLRMGVVGSRGDGEGRAQWTRCSFPTSASEEGSPWTSAELLL